MNLKVVESLCRQLLVEIGEDPNREGLVDTPKRWARWWQEFIEYDAGKTDVTFESVTGDQMVVVNGIKVFSLCEHHLLPFVARVSIGYLARDRVLGLSKFARIAQKHAHKLQLQERLALNIFEDVQALVNHDDIAVYIRGEHMCMQMRGIRSEGVMTTSVLRGVFRNPAPRQEFLELALSGYNVSP